MPLTGHSGEMKDQMQIPFAAANMSIPQAGVGRAVHRVSLACLPCRSRHLKCNAAKPSCSRCVLDAVLCAYTRSRRGVKYRCKQRVEAPKPGHLEDTDHPLLVLPSPSSSSSAIGAGGGDSGSGGSTSLTFPGLPGSKDVSRDTGGIHEDLVGLYYAFFHASHPCALPHWALQQHRASQPELFAPVLAVVKFIGSLFERNVASEPFRELADTKLQLHSGLATQTPHQVQAMLLYCIALYWCDEVEEGLRILDLAIHASRRLRMNEASFASEHGNGCPVLEESWRRTWWQLYVTDGHIAGSTRTFPTRIGNTPMTTLLPCEEPCYESGEIPPSRELAEYNMREFLPEDDPGFSSFAHLVGLTRALDLVLRRHVRDDETIATICSQADVSLSAWCSLLPWSKRSLMDSRQEVDVHLFKANMIVNTYIVDLHRQLSSLAYSEVESVARCAPPAPPARLRHSNSEDTHLHTTKAIISMRRLGDLLHLPSNIASCTPFIICMIANSLVAHLSACRYIFRDRTLQLERERVRSSMGTLRLLGEYWPLGKRTYREMGIIAREILVLSDQDIPRLPPGPEAAAQAHAAPQEPLPEMTMGPAVSWFDFENLPTMFGSPCEMLVPGRTNVEGSGFRMNAA